MLIVDGVPASSVPAIWDEARPYIRRALAEGAGHFTEEDIRAALLRRDMQLWAVRRSGAARHLAGVLVTEIVDWPRTRVCRLLLAGAEDGERASWLGWRDLVESWARAQGCGVMELYGRPGWARLLRHARKRVVLEWTL